MSNLPEKIKATGEVYLQLFNAAGDIVEERKITNLVVTTGLNHIAGRLSDTGTPSQMSHMALGESDLYNAGVTQGVAPADTTLSAQLGSRNGLTVAGGQVAGSTITYGATFAAGEATGAVVEAGIFNAASAGTMLCRTTFPVINKAPTDSLAVSWVVTIS